LAGPSSQNRQLFSEHPSKKIEEHNFDTWKPGAAAAMAHYSAFGIDAHKLNDKRIDLYAKGYCWMCLVSSNQVGGAFRVVIIAT
jgi:hypothetical protein